MTSPASQQQPSLRQDLVRITVLIYAKEGLIFEKFTSYWLNTYGPLISSLDIVKRNLTKYEQASDVPIQFIKRLAYPSISFISTLSRTRASLKKAWLYWRLSRTRRSSRSGRTRSV